MYTSLGVAPTYHLHTTALRCSFMGHHSCMYIGCTASDHALMWLDSLVYQLESVIGMLATFLVQVLL